MDIKFYSTTLGKISTERMIEEIGVFAKKDPHRYYKIIVGTDSQATAYSSLVTAVTIWRVGNGAIHFWTRSPEKRFGSMQDRIWQEAIASITLAQELRDRLNTALGHDFFWDGNEIHVDIGEKGPTQKLIDGIVGMIKGHDLTPVIKPYAFGASIVADRHT